MSKEQLHRLIDLLPPEKLQVFADMLIGMIDEDQEVLTDEEIAKYRRAQQEMRSGKFIHIDDVF